MSADERVDDLLDEWEELLAENPQADFEAFVRSQGVELEGELLASLRKKAVALVAMNRRLDALHDTNSIPADTASGSGKRLAIAQLQAGFEPIPGYKLVERLGAGGFGEVWKAIAPGEFPVALKFVRLDGKAGEIERRSLDVMRDVRHAHLLSVFGTWQQGDLLIIATELADRTLLDRHKEAVTAGDEGIPRHELLEYMAEAAKGVDFLNEPGTSGRPKIQHRDIKPQNLLLSGGSVKVGDFGLARAFQFDATGHTGSLTLAYAAPEFLDGKTSSRSDQYSLAVTYCFLRSGRLPFEGTEVQIIDGHRKQQPDLSMLPETEQPIVARALSKKPKDRWPSCTDFVRALADDKASPTKHTTKLGRITRYFVGSRVGRRRIAIALVAAFLANVVAIGVRYWFRDDGHQSTLSAESSDNEHTDPKVDQTSQLANADKPRDDKRVNLQLQDRNTDTQTRLAKCFADFPLSFVKFAASEQLKESKNQGFETQIRIEIDRGKYRGFVSQVREALSDMDGLHGSATLEIVEYSSRQELSYEKLFDPQSKETLENHLGSKKDTCFFMLSSSFPPSRPGEGGQLSVDWWVLDRDLAKIAVDAFRKVRLLQLQCAVVDARRETLAPTTLKPFDIEDAPLFPPVIPAGEKNRPYFQLDLNHSSFLFGRAYEHPEQVMLVLPAFFWSENPTERNITMYLSTSPKISVNFDLSREHATEAVKIMVEPRLPITPK